MTALFIRRSTDGNAGRVLASLPGTPDDLRALAKDIGASLGPLDAVFTDMKRHHSLSLSDLRATLTNIIDRVRRYRAARAHLREPYDPEDPRGPRDDDGANARAWFLFTQGDALVADLECVLRELEKLAEQSTDELVVTGY